MQKIVFYISGVGFGHLTRSIAIVWELIRQENVHITVRCHSSHMPLVLSTFRDELESVRVLPFDSGFQICFDANSGRVDVTATLQKIHSWLDGLESGAEAEAARCLTEGYSLILSDVAPEAFFVAEKLGVWSIGISNYTWYEFLQEHVGEQRLAGLKAMYQKAAEFLEYPLSTGAEIPIAVRRHVGLVSRPHDRKKIALLRQTYKRPGRLLLFLSVGGALSLHNVALSPDFDYLYTRGIDLAACEYARPIPVDTVDTQNYLAACDAVITKCGWSTVAEALIAEKPLFLLQSGEAGKEERYMLQELAELGVAWVIGCGERLCLEKGTFAAMNELKRAYEKIPARYTDQVGAITALICTRLGGRYGYY